MDDKLPTNRDEHHDVVGAALWRGYLDGVAAVLALDLPTVDDIERVAQRLGLSVTELAGAVIERRRAVADRDLDQLAADQRIGDERRGGEQS